MEGSIPSASKAPTIDIEIAIPGCQPDNQVSNGNSHPRTSCNSVLQLGRFSAYEVTGPVRYRAADTVREVRSWLEAAAIAEGHLFRAVSKSGLIGGSVDPGDVARVFKAMAASAGIPANLVATISGHSRRVGAAQDQAAAGIELPAIMASGDWRSPEMVSRYAKRLDARRSRSAKLAMMQNRG